MTTSPHLPDLIALRVELDSHKVPRCADLDAAITASEHVQHAMTATPDLPERVAGLTAEQLAETVSAIAARMDGPSMHLAGTRLLHKLQDEAADALRAHVPTILKTLRPAFTEAAGAVMAAADAGIRPNMSAEDVIDLDSADAIAAYRTLSDAFATLSSMARIRIRLSQLLGLAPQITPAQAAIGERVDYTACFVDESTGLTSGYGEGTSPWRWLSLALATGGKLALNDDETVTRMLHGEGESPGWIVAGASCVVSDDDGRQLMLYREYGDWVPTWVDAEQLDRLIDTGIVIAARPEAKRPADKHPLGAAGQPVRTQTSGGPS